MSNEGRSGATSCTDLGDLPRTVMKCVTCNSEDSGGNGWFTTWKGAVICEPCSRRGLGGNIGEIDRYAIEQLPTEVAPVHTWVVQMRDTVLDESSEWTGEERAQHGPGLNFLVELIEDELREATDALVFVRKRMDALPPQLLADGLRAQVYLVPLDDDLVLAVPAGELSDTDWQRLSGVELALETQLHAVNDELRDRVTGKRFAGPPAEAVRLMKKISPERVAELLAAQRLLIGGLRRWHELVALRRCAAGTLDVKDVGALSRRLDALLAQHEDLRFQVAELAKAAKRVRSRSAWQRLWKDGLLIGASNDKRDLRKVRRGRRALKRSARPPKRALPVAPARRALTAAAPASPTAAAS